MVVVVALFVLSGGVALASDGSLSACPNRPSPGFRAYLPDCRAYELVSPPYKEGFPTVFTAASEANEAGTHVLVRSFGSFSTPEDISGLGQAYDIVRTDTEWQTVPLDVPFSQLARFYVESVSPDFQRSLFVGGTPAQPGAEDVYRGSPKGPLTRVGPGEPPGVGEKALEFVGASDDLSHMLFIDSSPNPGEKNHLWPGDTTAEGRLPSLYEYAGADNLEPRLVGVSNTGVPPSVGTANLISNCGTYLGSREGDAYNAIATSGAVVYFTAAGVGGECGSGPLVDEVYARIEGSQTVPISEPSFSVPGRVCTEECATAENVLSERRGGIFAGASLDGSKVFFMTSQPLVNADMDDGVDLYEAEIGENPSTHTFEVIRLAQVSHGSIPASSAEVLGVARVSEDGSHTYFVAAGVLTGENAEGKTPVAGAPNLYGLASECPSGGITCASPTEHLSFVATLSLNDGRDWDLHNVRPVQATPNGRFLVFQSTADLTPDQEEREEAGQVFEYDAKTEFLVRVSRGQEGYHEDGNSSLYPATIPLQIYERAAPTERFTRMAMSEDGSRVVFSSENALTPLALNGFNNVYEYHDGRVSLISDGHDVVRINEAPAVELIGIGRSGVDVFFRTADRLVPQDTDYQVDFYDARINGGFAAPSTPTSCLADSCQAAAGGQPSSLLVPITSSVAGEIITSSPPKPKAKIKGKPKKRKSTKAKKHRHKKRKRTAKGRR